MESGGHSHSLAEFTDVRLSFGEKEILRGLSLRVNANERLVVLGESGVGKSTLLRLIPGLLRPSSGRVHFKGHEVTRMSRRALNRMRPKIGMVYQYSALLSSLTVRDNLALPLEELTTKARGEIDRLVDEKLALVDMSASRNQLPSELSGGMRKRVGLARALMLEPELILYDEPTAGLDPVVSALIDELIMRIGEQEGVGSIIVTHEMGSAFKIATRMAMLYEGTIIAEGTPESFRVSKDPVVSQFVEGRTVGPILERRRNL